MYSLVSVTSVAQKNFRKLTFCRCLELEFTFILAHLCGLLTDEAEKEKAESHDF